MDVVSLKETWLNQISRYCVLCHGILLGGNPPLMARLEPCLFNWVDQTCQLAPCQIHWVILWFQLDSMRQFCCFDAGLSDVPPYCWVISLSERRPMEGGQSGSSHFYDFFYFNRTLLSVFFLAENSSAFKKLPGHPLQFI